jgi:hypothetical protein
MNWHFCFLATVLILQHSSFILFAQANSHSQDRYDNKVHMQHDQGDAYDVQPDTGKRKV